MRDKLFGIQTKPPIPTYHDYKVEERHEVQGNIFAHTANANEELNAFQGIISTASRRKNPRMLLRPGTSGSETHAKQFQVEELKIASEKSPSVPERVQVKGLEQELYLESREEVSFNSDEGKEDELFVGAAYKPTIAASGTPSALGELPETRKLGNPKEEKPNTSIDATKISEQHTHSLRSINYPPNYEGGKEIAVELEECKKKLKEALKDKSNLELMNAKLKEELEKKDVHYEVEKLQKHREEIARINEGHLEELKKLQEAHTRSIGLIEMDKEQTLRLEKESWQQEKNRLQELHKLDIDSIKRQHEQNIVIVRRQVEIENNATKNQLEHETQLTKLTTQVDSIMATMRAKIDIELKEKVQAIQERELKIEEEKRKLELEKTRLEIERRKAEDIEKLYKNKEKFMQQEIDQQRELYRYQRDASEGQYKELIKEIDERREKLIIERKQIEDSIIQLEKMKKDWGLQCAEDKAQLLMEKKVLEKQKEEFNIYMEQEIQAINEKMAVLSIKHEEVIKEKTELQRKLKMWEEKSKEDKRNKDELHLEMERVNAEKRRLEVEKKRLEELAYQVEEESRIIYNYKESIGKTREELEQMRADIDNKTIALRAEKARVDYKQKEVNTKQQALEDVHVKYIREKPKLSKSVLESRVPIEIHKAKEQKVIKQPTMNMKRGGLFRASEFINNLERDYGNQPEFTDYIVSEKNRLLVSRKDLNGGASQSNFFARGKLVKKDLTFSSNDFKYFG